MTTFGENIYYGNHMVNSPIPSWARGERYENCEPFFSRNIKLKNKAVKHSK